MQKYGYNVIGYDLSDVRIKLANAVTKSKYTNLKAKLNFIPATLTMPIPGQREGFDCTILCAVLEHVPDPFTLLRQCFERTKSGGYIIISVPNICISQTHIGFIKRAST